MFGPAHLVERKCPEILSAETAFFSGTNCNLTVSISERNRKTFS